MRINHLNFSGLRNLGAIDMAPGHGINLISGANGSGKTSLLEGIHVLGMGRSFRTRQLKHAIAHDASEMTLFARLAGDPRYRWGSAGPGMPPSWRCGWQGSGWIDWRA